jgi:hypothetical protein
MGKTAFSHGEREVRGAQFFGKKAAFARARERERERDREITKKNFSFPSPPPTGTSSLLFG